MAIGFKVVWKAAAILNKKQRWKRRIFVIFTLCFALLNYGNELFFIALK
jgi:predicted nucleic acid-binding Zn ribbon protein